MWPRFLFIKYLFGFLAYEFGSSSNNNVWTLRIMKSGILICVKERSESFVCMSWANQQNKLMRINKFNLNDSNCLIIRPDSEIRDDLFPSPTNMLACMTLLFQLRSTFFFVRVKKSPMGWWRVYFFLLYDNIPVSWICPRKLWSLAVRSLIYWQVVI